MNIKISEEELNIENVRVIEKLNLPQSEVYAFYDEMQDTHFEERLSSTLQKYVRPWVSEVLSGVRFGQD